MVVRAGTVMSADIISGFHLKVSFMFAIQKKYVLLVNLQLKDVILNDDQYQKILNVSATGITSIST